MWGVTTCTVRDIHLPCGGNATEQSRLSLTLLIRIIAVVALRCGDCDHVTVPYSTSIYTITDGARPSVPPNPVASCSTMCEQSSSLSVVEKEGMHVPGYVLIHSVLMRGRFQTSQQKASRSQRVGLGCPEPRRRRTQRSQDYPVQITNHCRSVALQQVGGLGGRRPSSGKISQLSHELYTGTQPMCPPPAPHRRGPRPQAHIGAVEYYQRRQCQIYGQ